MIDDWTLIDAVREHPELYDKKHSGFKNPAIKLQAWRTVAAVVRETQGEDSPVISPKAAAARWQNLRERYAREVKKVKESNLDLLPTSPAWPHLSSMSFLQPHVHHRRKTFTKIEWSPDTCPSPPVGAATSCIQQPWNKSDYSMMVDLPIKQNMETHEVSSPCFKPFAQKRRASSLSETDAHFLKRDVNRAVNEDFVRTTQTDPDYLLGKSVESVLKAIKDPRLRTEFRRKFRDLISDCEQRLLEIQ